MAKYLVTGGAGFIGSHLSDVLLRDGHTVLVLDDLSTGRRANLDPHCELIVGDVADAALVRSAMQGVVGCFHLAAIASVARSSEDWLGTHRANQTGTITVLDAARARQTPVVYASSAAVYGETSGADPVPESHPTRPRTAYGADKLGSELHAAVASGVHGVPTMGLRFFNVYGARQNPSSPYSGVISILAARVAEAQPLTIHGDGLQTRDFIHVTDVVSHLQAAMRLLHRDSLTNVLNVCTGRATSVRTLAEVLSRIAGYTPEIVKGSARPGDIRHSLGDPSAATALLGVRAMTQLEEGLTTTLRYLSEAAWHRQL
jgi:UDP-glucose 4-epimerase